MGDLRGNMLIENYGIYDVLLLRYSIEHKFPVQYIGTRRRYIE